MAILRYFLRWLLVSIAVFALAVILLRLLFPLPSLDDRPVTASLPPDQTTHLGARLLPQMTNAPGLSGMRLLSDGRDAFAARVLLARAATRSIDAQYYIWQGDATGWMLLQELAAAAARGVRVRLLVDDNGISGMDDALGGLDGLETAEVRLFNPFMLRTPKMLSYIFDFFRLNRRMHNKSFTVDGVATVVGGRNIGDIYFSYGEGTAFIDLDALAVGQAAADVSKDFDRYWMSASAYPAAQVLSPTRNGLMEIEREAETARSSNRSKAYEEAVKQSGLVQGLLDESLPLVWAPATLLSDDPSKGLGNAAVSDTLLSRLLPEIQRARASLDLLSAYFVPGRLGTDILLGLVNRNIRVRVVTNTFDSTDVAVVHAHYAKWRRALVDGGVTLLELRRLAERAERPDLASPRGSSGTSLHAKTFAIDRKRLFVGSFNFDPRSARLNTEMGLLVESPALAERLASELDAEALAKAYLVREAPDGSLEWVTDGEEGEVRLATEPNTTLLSRTFMTILGFLPIGGLL